jgi:hypothetical protein
MLSSVQSPHRRRERVMFRFSADHGTIRVVQCMDATARVPLGHAPQSTLQLAHFVSGLVSAGVVGAGLAGHALARACAVDAAPAGTLRSPRVLRRAAHRYDDPLGRLLRRARFRR